MSTSSIRGVRDEPPVGALAIITLGVTDLARSVAFYTAFGWPPATSSVPGVICWLDLGTTWLGLYPMAELAADSGLDHSVSRGAAQFGGVTLAVNLPDRAAVESVLSLARSAGATITLPPVDTDYGVYHACFADPDGHVWEVAHNPAFPLVNGRTIIP